MIRTIARILFLCAGVFLSGCATIVSGNETTTYIETDPQKARCELRGENFKRVVETPDSIHLSAKAAPIEIRCNADGYHETVAELDTRADGWFIGNVLIGGIFGLVVDAATQSGMKYPTRISIGLDPKGFKTSADRDAWYKRRRKLVEQKWLEEFFASSQSVDCDTSSEAAKQRCFDEYASGVFKIARDDTLEDLKKKYDAAEIGVDVAPKPAHESNPPARSAPPSAPVARARPSMQAVAAPAAQTTPARAKQEIEEKFERLIAARRKERYTLACDKSAKNARSQACRDVAFQIRLLQETKRNELDSTERLYRQAVAKKPPIQTAVPRQSRDENIRGIQNRIAALKAQGPWQDCLFEITDSYGRDAPSHAACQERREEILALHKDLARERSEPTRTARATSKSVRPVEAVKRPKSRDEIVRKWKTQIEAVKFDGPYEDCVAATVNNTNTDRLVECEARAKQIAGMRRNMKRELNGLIAANPSRTAHSAAAVPAPQKQCAAEDKVNFSRENVAIKAAIRDFAFAQGIGEPYPSRSITKFMSLTPKSTVCGAIEVRAAIVVPLSHLSGRDTNQIHSFYLQKEGREFRVVRCGSC